MKTYQVFTAKLSQAIQADSQAEAIFIFEHTYPGIKILKVEELLDDHEP